MDGRWILFGSCAMALLSCGDDAPPIGSLGGACGPQDPCESGLTCDGTKCVDPTTNSGGRGGAGAESGAGATGGEPRGGSSAGGDSGSGAGTSGAGGVTSVGCGASMGAAPPPPPGGFGGQPGPGFCIVILARAEPLGGTEVCAFEVPEGPVGEAFDPTTVNLQIQYADRGAPELVPYVTTECECATYDEVGWYFDDPTEPRAIYTCDATCADVQEGVPEFALGCATIVAAPR